MKNKQAQSILDLLNIFVVELPEPPISNKEAQALYDLWKSGKQDAANRIVVQNNVDPIQIQSLQMKGMLRTPGNLFASHHDPVVELTSKGKEIIKQIILATNDSVYEESSDIDYAKIYRKLILGNPKEASAKTASKQIRHGNWLQRLTCK